MAVFGLKQKAVIDLQNFDFYIVQKKKRKQENYEIKL